MCAGLAENHPRSWMAWGQGWARGAGAGVATGGRPGAAWGPALLAPVAITQNRPGWPESAILLLRSCPAVLPCRSNDDCEHFYTDPGAGAHAKPGGPGGRRHRGRP